MMLSVLDIVVDKFPDKHPREWTEQALMTLEQAMDPYVVEVIAESDCSKQQFIS